MSACESNQILSAPSSVLDRQDHAVIEHVRRARLVRRRDLARLGLSDYRLAQLVERGHLIRVGKGVYTAEPALASGPVGQAIRVGGELTCVSALGLFGLAGVGRQDQGIHVTKVRASDAEVSQAGCSFVTGHRRSGSLHKPGIVTMRRAVVDMLRCRPPLRSLIVLDEVARRGPLALDELHLDLPGKRNAPLRRLVADATPSSASPLETIARVLLRPHGWRVQSQVVIDGVGRVDFLIEGRVVLETDGYEFHSSKEAFVRDRRRDAELVARGFVVVRASAEDLYVRWTEFEARLVRIVEGRP